MARDEQGRFTGAQGFQLQEISVSCAVLIGAWRGIHHVMVIKQVLLVISYGTYARTKIMKMGQKKSQKSQHKYRELRENYNRRKPLGRGERNFIIIMAISMMFSGVLRFLGLIDRPLYVRRNLLFIQLVSVR